MDEQACVCFQGATCKCGGVKREPIDLSLPQIPHTIKSRPKLTSVQSETSLLTVTNGQHRPCHRLNNAAHTSGAPYKIPRSFHPQNRPGHNRTISIDTAQPHRQFGQPYSAFPGGSSNNGLPVPGQGTVDDMHLLGLNGTGLYGNLGQRSVDNLSNLYSGPMDQWLTMPTSAPNPNLPYMGSAPFAQSAPSNINDVVESKAQTSWMPYSVAQTVPTTYSSDSVIASPVNDWGNLSDVDWATIAGLDASFSAGDLPLNGSKLSNTSIQPLSNCGDSLQHSACGAQSEASEFGFLNELGTDWPALDRASTNASAAQNLFDLSNTSEAWPAPSSSSDSDQEQDIEFYRSDTIKPPKTQVQPISLTIPSSVSPPSQYTGTPSQYASAAASGQTSPVVFSDAWESQPASATSYTFAAGGNKNDIDPHSLTNSLEQVQGQGFEETVDWDALLRAESGDMYATMQGLDVSTQPTTQAPMNLMPGMMVNQTNMWLANQQ